MTDIKQPLLIRIFKNGKLVEVKQFTNQQVVIGREGDINLAINDASISPIHAMLEERESGKYHLCDLGSQSGTFINGQRIVDTYIESGSEFQIGDFTLEFHVGVPKPKKTSSASSPAYEANKSQPIFTKPSELPKELPKHQPTRPAPRPAASPGMATIGSTTVRQPPKGTFAPPSNARINETTKSSSGNVVEVVLAWKDRVIDTYHFDKKQIVQIGSHPKNNIVLPIFGSVRLSHPILKIEGSATVILTADMTGEVSKDNSTKTFDELRRGGSMASAGTGYTYTLQQGEVIKISFGEGVQLIIRYVGSAPLSRIAPLIDISVNQLTGLVVGLMGMALFIFYAFIYAPALPEKEEEETIPPRKAQFFYKRPVSDLSEITEPSAKTAQEAIKDKEVATERGEEGASQDAKPNKSQSTKKIPTTDKAGKSKGIQKIQAGKSADTGAKSAAKDVSKTGVLSVFGTKGVQDQLSKAFQGSGNVAGLSKSATGEGAEAAGAGITPGAGLRETGAGGQGTATVGISGVNTKGRGGGVSGYGTGNLGAKKNATVLPGGDEATFSPGIDKEAIRRVVKANLKQIQACYEKGLNKEPSLYGKITIRWSIGPGGNVLEAGIKATTMNSSEVENCAVARLRTWKFPEPPANQIADVSYPFVFQAQE
ncbi:MAG: AgmX/PglI C-terminal domain-containing protein [Oligoflexia bacterium]|nr:AgmX/PglI C-terminal domain-containing protein [Oligoflexia bacterium]